MQKLIKMITNIFIMLQVKTLEELETEKKEERKAKIQKDIEYFTEISKNHKDEYTCASLICTYSATGAWSLYIGNDEVATYTGTVNRLYYEFMKGAYDNGYEYADLFGVVGDPKTKYKNLYVLPATINLAGIDIELLEKSKKEQIMKFYDILKKKNINIYDLEDTDSTLTINMYVDVIGMSEKLDGDNKKDSVI